MQAVQQSRLWFLQAGSDVRTAEAIITKPKPMLQHDVGCHVAALCAQSVEKSIKGYMLLNGESPAMDHRPDKYLTILLDRSGKLLRYPGHLTQLSRLFVPLTRQTVRQLLDMTPGGRKQSPGGFNSEYPWKERGEWQHAPVGNLVFSDQAALQRWVDTAKLIQGTLYKLCILVDRSTIQ